MKKKHEINEIKNMSKEKAFEYINLFIAYLQENNLLKSRKNLKFLNLMIKEYLKK